MVDFSSDDLRNACGQFATGVAIVTTTDAAGAAVGMTVNSFASVSLDPPLVLWSVARDSQEYPAFSESGHHAIHILHAGQHDLSNRFAVPAQDKFTGIEWQTGSAGSPLLTDYLICLQCSTEHCYSGGDHSILVGRVVEISRVGESGSHSGLQPLLFHGGEYRSLAVSSQEAD